MRCQAGEGFDPISCLSYFSRSTGIFVLHVRWRTWRGYWHLVKHSEGSAYAGTRQTASVITEGQDIQLQGLMMMPR